MHNIEAVRALSALGHETRLSIFRALVQAGPEGLAAGDIARMLDLAPNALSFHLKDLTHAGLTESRQNGRFVIYSVVYPAMTGLLDYLTENCCGGVDCTVATPPPPPVLARVHGEISGTALHRARFGSETQERPHPGSASMGPRRRRSTRSLRQKFPLAL